MGFETEEALPDLEGAYPEEAQKYMREHPVGLLRFLYDIEGNPEDAVIESNVSIQPRFKHFSVKNTPNLPEILVHYFKKYGEITYRLSRDLKDRITGVIIPINSKPLYSWIEQQLECNATKLAQG